MIDTLNDSFECQLELFHNEELYFESIQKRVEHFFQFETTLSHAEKESEICAILSENAIGKYRFKKNSFDLTIFLSKIQKYLNNDNILKIFFHINDMCASLNFIKNNFQELKHAFQTHYLSFNDLNYDDEFDDIFEYQYAIQNVYHKNALENEIIMIPCIYNSSEVSYLLFEYFFDDLKFIFLHRNGNDVLYGIMYNLSWEYTKKILIELYEKNNIQMFKNALSYTNLPDVHTANLLGQPFYNMNFLSDIFLRDDFFNYLCIEDSPIHFAYGHEDAIRSSLEPGMENATTLFSNDFFANLNYLKTIPRSLRVHHPIFQKDYQIFYDYCCDYFSFSLDNYQNIVKSLFHRLISGESIFKLLFSRSEAAFYHFYKTNEVISFSDDDLLYVKNYSTKQYFAIKDLLCNVECVPSSKIIKYLYYIPFDILYKLIVHKVSTCNIEKILNYRFKDEKMRFMFLQMIEKDLETFSQNVEFIKSILEIFSYLYEQNYPHITLQKLLKRLGSLEYLLTPNCMAIKQNLNLFDSITKGDPISEKIAAIELYNDYRMREYSSIPNLKGTYGDFIYEMVDMHAPEIISNGVDAYLHSNAIHTATSCLTPNGKAKSCLRHGAVNEHGRFFKITYKGKIVTYSWVWRSGDILCFDNIEVTDTAKKFKDYATLIFNIYKKASQDLLHISEMNEQSPIKAISVGRNKKDVLDKPFTDLKRLDQCFQPNANGLYLDDSKENQYLLAGDDTSIYTAEAQAIYCYNRKKEREVSLDHDVLEQLNSIYFDYCIYRNIKFTPLKKNYTKCILGDDWFVGFLEHGSYEFYYRAYHENALKEASKYINTSKEKPIEVPFIRSNYPDLNYYLNASYEYNEQDVIDYLHSLKATLKTIRNEDFFHNAGSIENIGKILYDHAITSSFFGKHKGGRGSNGEHFICVALLSSPLYKTLMHGQGFIIDQNICSFKTGREFRYLQSDDFLNSRYPFRQRGGEGEYQVLDYISLDLVKAIQVDNNFRNIGIITYLQELTDNHIPLVYQDHYALIEPSEIKRLIRFK